MYVIKKIAYPACAWAKHISFLLCVCFREVSVMETVTFPCKFEGRYKEVHLCLDGAFVWAIREMQFCQRRTFSL